MTINQDNTRSDWALLLLRIMAGGLMLTHGVPKMLMLSTAESIQFPSVFGLAPVASLTLAVIAEVFCSLLLIFGFATRLATIPLILTMLVAAFKIHIADPFGKQEPALLYLTMFVVLLISGAGRFSIDHALKRKKPVRSSPNARIGKKHIPSFLKANG